MAGFFGDIPSVKKTDAFLLTLGIVMGMVLLGVQANFPDELRNSNIYLIILVVWGLGAVIEISSKKADSFFDVLTLNTPSIAFQSLFIGLAAGGMLFFIGQSVAVPLTNLAVNGDGQKYLLKFLYVVLAAPFVEENFFRGWFMPNLSKFTSAWSGLSQTVTGVLSILVANGFFALYHGWAYGFNANLMFSAFLFGLVSTALLYKTRSIAGSIGLHFVNNLRAFLS